MSKEIDGVHIKVFITKSCKFRVIVKEGDKPSYEVTVGGNSWVNGKGREYEERIRVKCNSIVSSLTDELKIFKKELTLKEYLDKRVKEGFINGDGHPLKCDCGETDFNQVDMHYGEGHLEEYSLQCTNEDCLKTVGSWAYGHWEV